MNAMLVNQLTVVAFVLIFTRISACLLVSPLFGNQLPLIIRIGLCGAVSFALLPVLQGSFSAMPGSLLELVLLVGHEALIGLLLGMCLQVLALAVQMAGSLVDMQIGLSSAQLFNPMTNSVSTIFANFKSYLCIVLIFLMNGHHLMFQAFFESYRLQPSMPSVGMPGLEAGIFSLLGRMLLLAVQIAAAPAAVTMVIDIAAAFINKAVPQMQVFLVAMPAKILAGLLAVAIGLPMMVIGVSSGVDSAFDFFGRALGGR